jgi:hypothetical protein
MMAYHTQAMTGDGHDGGKRNGLEDSFSRDKFQYPKKLAEFRRHRKPDREQ